MVEVAQSLPPLLSFLEAAKARDVVLEKVSANSAEWMALALIELEQLSLTQTGWANLDQGFTGEWIRQAVTPACGHPHHNNAFGALVREALRRKLIVPTGEYRAMRMPGSHARKTPVYKWAC